MREKMLVAAASILATTLLLLPTAGRAAEVGPTQASAEQPISDFIDVAAEANQMAPEIAYGAQGQALAAWGDDRLETPRIFVSILTDGGASKVTGFDLSRSTQFLRTPVVAYSDGRYLVTWLESDGPTAEVHGAVLDDRGDVLTPDHVLLLSSDDNPTIAVAGGPAGFMVAALNEKSHLVAVPVDHEGKAGTPVEVYDEGTVGHPSLTYGNNQYLLSFLTCGEEDCRFGARAARLTPKGKVLDPDGLPLARPSADFRRISGAWDGTRYLVVWTQNGQIMGSYVAPDERPGSSGAFPITAAQGASSPDVVWTGSSFVVAWVEVGNTVMTTFVEDMLEAASAAQTPVSERATYVTRPVLASDGSRTTILWDAPGGDFMDVLGEELLPMGAPTGEGGVVVQSANGQIHPSITAGVGSYLALWQDYRAHKGPEVYGGRIGPSGELLDPAGFRISPQNGRHPVAAWNGESWLVVWIQTFRGRDHALMAARVLPDGSVQDPSSIPVVVSGGRKDHVRVASDGDGFVVIWRDKGTDTARTAYVSSQGIPASETTQLERHAYAPSIAWHGDRYIAVWSRNGDIKGAYLDAKGQPIDAARRITSNGSIDLEPSVASNGERAFITWSRCRNSYEDCASRDIFGVMSAASLDVTSPVELGKDERLDDEPTSVWDGAGFGVVWKSCAIPEVCDRPAAYLRWVDEAGSPNSTTTELARAHITGAPAFSVTSLGDGTIALSYRRIDGPPGVTGVPRGYLRTARRL